VVASLRGRAARGALHVLALKAIGTVVGRLSEIILPLFLLPADLGVFALAAFFSGLLALGGELGMSTALVRWKDRFAEAANTAFVLRLALAVALVGGSLALGWGASQIYAEPRLTGAIVVLSVGLVFQAIAMVPRVIATRDLDFLKAGVPDSAGKIAAAVATIGFAVFSFAYWSPIYGAVLGLAFGAGLQVAFSKWRPRREFRRDLAKEIVRFGKFVSLSVFANFIGHSVDAAIVGLLLGVSSLGFYAVAYSWGVYFPSNISSVLAAISYPVLSHVSDSSERLKRVLSENLRYFSYVSVCLSVGVAVLAPVFVLSIYGGVWSPAIAPMRLLAIAGLLLGYAGIAQDALLARGLSRTVSLISGLEAIFLLVLLAPATLYGGLLGTSLAALAAAVVVAFGMSRAAARAVGLSWRAWAGAARDALIAGVVTGVPLAILTFFLPTSLPVLLLGAASFIAGYVGVLQVLTRGQFLGELRNILHMALRTRLE